MLNPVSTCKEWLNAIEPASCTAHVFAMLPVISNAFMNYKQNQYVYTQDNSSNPNFLNSFHRADDANVTKFQKLNHTCAKGLVVQCVIGVAVAILFPKALVIGLALGFLAYSYTQLELSRQQSFRQESDLTENHMNSMRK